jgi:hypothetical protein
MVLIAGCAGLLLVVLAVPRVAGHAMLLPHGAVREALDRGTAVKTVRLEAAHAALARAGAWLPSDAAISRDRARVARRLARLTENPETSDRLMNAAALDLRAAAAAAPADGFTWVLLADTELAAGKPVEEVLPSLRLARLTAPRRASAILLTHGIVMRHWEAMPEEMRTHGMADAVAFWRQAPYRPFLLQTYLDAGFEARAAFRQELAIENPRLLEQFDRSLPGGTRR